MLDALYPLVNLCLNRTAFLLLFFQEYAAEMFSLHQLNVELGIMLVSLQRYASVFLCFFKCPVFQE